MDIENVLPGEGGTGDRLWVIATRDYLLSPAELALLGRACSALNRCDELEVAVAESGLVDLETGRVTPAAVELRLVSQEAAKLLAGLHMPGADEDGEGAWNPQAPRGPRGPNDGRSLRAVEGGRS
ncbi:hypothetical protein ACI792_04420 [Blastococcus sp. SYSU DS0669]